MENASVDSVYVDRNVTNIETYIDVWNGSVSGMPRLDFTLGGLRTSYTKVYILLD